eukprot:gnl/TRDRNA2_/TRDRNA2_40644_c0_seq1.p2 gnl/TRDRNA2_/TRDRNA2_40644_c0~~gnl/TRDRNA2_/TRDRNA2_40644_c0_seq1.p2  ORF type:complete len:247 (+),score=54.07 gnl/TRDRNA2_/TRDRNA2_40644_c0_seq1:92-832(+)
MADAHDPLKRTNREGEDLAEPLPATWDLQKLREMPVTLYGMKISPPCCKIRFLLTYYKVPFAHVQGQKPGTDYKKIPVLDIADRQINDSFIMVKSLAPILQGRPLREEELDLEKQVAFGLMVALEREAAGSISDMWGCGGLMGGGSGCVLRAAAPCIVCCVSRSIGKDRPLLSLREYADLLRMHLGASSFFGGGEPSIVDVSLFGTLLAFVRAGNSCVERLFGPSDDKLRAWHTRMQKRCEDIDIF